MHWELLLLPNDQTNPNKFCQIGHVNDYSQTHSVNNSTKDFDFASLEISVKNCIGGALLTCPS